MNISQICADVARRHNVKKSLVERLYKSYWLFMRDKFTEMDLKKDYTQEEFNKKIMSVTVPCIGRIACTWDTYVNTRKSMEYIKKIRDERNKENKEDSSNV